MKRVLHMRFLLLMFLALGLMVDRIGPWNTVGGLKQCLNRKASTITCPIGYFFHPYINVAVYRYLEFLKESCEPSKPVLLLYRNFGSAQRI